jgi:dGTPase
MDWKKLLSTKRLKKLKAVSDIAQQPRTEFTRDYDRIVFSSAFRRLQDKTQVFPLAKSDYVRTRLTHSLEVASVGRSLGMLAAEIIAKKDPASDTQALQYDIGNIVAAACLAHDIGNPPFGHAGEFAIQEWCNTSNYVADARLNPAHCQDLCQFEGNAQGFRTLCRLQNLPQPGGLQLTCAVLGAFTKYPRASHVSITQAKGISGKKFGFMQSEAELFAEVADEVGLIRKPGDGMAWHRHPLAFLVEAADDICYHVMDIEDGFKAGVLNFTELEALHKPWLTPIQKTRAAGLTIGQRRAEYYRAVTIDRMIRDAIVVFEANYDGLLSGDFDSELMQHVPHARAFAAFKQRAIEKVYVARQVVEIEACGYEVIGGLLAAFVEAIEVNAAGSKVKKARSRTILNLLPGGEASVAGLGTYERLLIATDFVSGMTDSYAVDLYQRIRGISLP